MQDQLTEQAAKIGTEHGRNAASYVFDGNTTDDTYRAVLAGIDDGDPQVMDAYRTPGLSGEYGDDYSERDLISDLTSDECRDQGHDASDHEDWDDAASAYSDAASEAFWAEIERIARDHVLPGRVSALRSAGFSVRYAYRPDEGQSYIAWHDLSDSPVDAEPFVNLSSIARGDDAAGQTTTLARSNYRSLVRDYPDTFCPVSYANVDALGTFVADLSDELTEVLTGLAEEYPVYDEEDMSELESDETTESYADYARADAEHEMDEETRDLWDQLALVSDTAQESLWWQVCSDNQGNDYAEHDGYSANWDLRRFLPALSDALAAFFSAAETMPGQGMLFAS